MRGRDPALIVLGARGDSRAISTNDSDLLGGIDLLGALGRLLGALTTLAAALLLGEEGGDPGVVDEVHGSSESTEEDEVEENAVERISPNLQGWSMKARSHLGVEQAGGPFNNGDGLVVGGDCENGVLGVPQNGDELETEILGVELGGEGVGHSLLSAGGDLNRVLLRGEVAHDLRLAIGLLEKRATNDAYANGLGLIVGDGQTRLGDMAVDHLDTKDLALRERGRDLDVQVRCLGLRDFLDILNLRTRGSVN